LWNSDGTSGGTALVKDINPGPGSSDPSDLTACKGHALSSPSSLIGVVT